MKLVANRIRTPDGTVLQSFYQHDYKEYRDANGETYMVDGGLSYLRRNINVIPYQELSVRLGDPHELVREAFHRGGRGKDGKQPLTWVALRDMDTEWLRNALEYQKTYHYGNPLNQIYVDEIRYREDHGL